MEVIKITAQQALTYNVAQIILGTNKENVSFIQHLTPFQLNDCYKHSIKVSTFKKKQIIYIKFLFHDKSYIYHALTIYAPTN